MKLYHGTNEEALRSIRESGMRRSYGRFGSACYFYTDREEAVKWSDGSIYEIEVVEESLLHINYEAFFKKHHPELSIEEEEGYPSMYEYCKGDGQLGVAITYGDGITEVCLYNWEDMAKTAFFYHVTLDTNLLSIFEKGLVPQVGERSKDIGGEPEVVWLFPTVEDKNSALGSWLGEWYEEEYGEDVKLSSLEIELPLDFTIINLDTGYEVMTTEVIPPECIRYLQGE